MTDTGDKDPELPHDPVASLAETIEDSHGAYNEAAQRLLQRQRLIGGEPGELGEDLAGLAERTRLAEAVVSARATASGGEHLTPDQVRLFILAVGASAAFTAAFDQEPAEVTAMVNRLLTTPDLKAPDFTTRLGIISTQLKACSRAADR